MTTWRSRVQKVHEVWAPRQATSWGALPEEATLASATRPAPMPKDGKKPKDERVVDSLRIRPYSNALTINIQKVGKLEGVHLSFE